MGIFYSKPWPDIDFQAKVLHVIEYFLCFSPISFIFYLQVSLVELDLIWHRQMGGKVFWTSGLNIELGCWLAYGFQVFRLKNVNVMVSYLYLIHHRALVFLTLIFKFQVYVALIFVVSSCAFVIWVIWNGRRIKSAEKIKRIVITCFEGILSSEGFRRYAILPSCLDRKYLIFDFLDLLSYWSHINRRIMIVLYNIFYWAV